LDSIPIVKRTNTVFDRLYAVYPCLIVDDWDKITQGLLAANKKNLQLQIAAFKSKFPGWFQDPATIREIMDLM
jgi:hypothetical protein